jgi:hypothetical protein
MIPLKIRQKLSYIKNRIEQYNFNKKQVNKINSLLNDVIYGIDYEIIVNKTALKK